METLYGIQFCKNTTDHQVQTWWGYRTLQSAIDHAKDYLEDDSNLTHCNIVKEAATLFGESQYYVHTVSRKEG